MPWLKSPPPTAAVPYFLISMTNIELAQPGDYAELRELIDLANKNALDKSGAPLWTMMDVVGQALKTNLERGECYIIRNNGRITSCICLQTKDRLWPDDDQALYFHKWMKHPSLATDGEAIKLLKFAATETGRRGKKYLRCDTVSDLEGLLTYYKRLGFHQVKHFIYDFSDRSGVLLEANAQEIND